MFSLLPPSGARGQGMGVMVSCYCRCSERGVLPLLPWGPSPGRQSLMDLSVVSPSLGQQFFPNCCPVGHSSMECSPSPMSCTNVGPPQGPQVLPRKTLLHRCLPPPRAAVPQQDPAPSWASHRVTASFMHPPAPAWAPPWAAGAPLLHHGLHHGLQGLSSGAWSTSCPSFCTDLGVCLVPMFSLCSSLAGIFSVQQPSVLKHIITEAILLLLIGLALVSGRKSILEPTGIGSTGQGKLLAASNRSHPCSPSLLPKPNPLHMGAKSFLILILQYTKFFKSLHNSIHEKNYLSPFPHNLGTTDEPKH
ncbi:uncharacterized protein LOC127467021 [Manacus candei]|uniref:uncharacterized protein LOC127467021 n=1 Tax=Manacus candei TaxID=415023 RepID=UPI002227A508|nr:uncharacterized protein LOC127467021 [Manacus candei]